MGPHANADQAAAALVAWLEARHGDGITLVEPPSSKGEGFDSEIHLIHLAGDVLPEAWRRPLVIRVKADADRLAEAHREAAVQRWAADLGYPTPRVLHVFAAGELVGRPAQVMERAPGIVMLDRFARPPWRARRTARLLASLHARLHQLPPDGFPAGNDLLDHRLALPRRVAEALDDDELRSGLGAVAAVADELRDAPLAPCHGDFHPLNVMVDTDGAATVLDWTDAGVGDRHGDVARTLALFDLAAIAANSPAERAALRVVGPILGGAYRRAYEQLLPLDPHRLARWRAVHLLHGWSQATALHAGLFDREDDHDHRKDRVPPAMVEQLRGRFHESLAASTEG